MLIHELFTEAACRTPNTIAVVDDITAYTYRELDELTNSVAAELQAAGIGPESVVGCWSNTSVMTVVQVLAVLKAGGAYLLLDPHLPHERLRYLVHDADPTCLLCDTRPPDTVADGRPVLSMGEMRGATTPIRAAVAPENLAYVAYTSGSTGKPKGVLITHAAVVNHAVAFRAQFELSAGDRLPLMAPVAFDMATEEMLPPLIAGCTLLDAPHRSPTMQEFTEDVLTSGYTILNIPAPLWHQWTAYLRDTDSAVPPTLRLVIVGSDKIYTSTLQEWQSLRGAAAVWWVAAYGVTEATVTSLLYLTAAQDDLRDEPLVPIGTPLANVTAHVVDGELYIGGAGLARGYRGLPEKTAERFVRDPFSRAEGARWYRTGDLVRQRPDGTIVWLGRQDSQIKINGLRIEPAEIEATIHEYPSVNEAIVIFTPSTVAGRPGTLVGYVEAKPGEETDIAALSAFLRTRLHPLMVPERIVLLDRIPLNANGKLDRNALEIQTARC